MTQDDLKLAMDSLHRSLSDSPQLDAQTAEKLRGLIREIESSIAENPPESDSAPQHEGLAQQVQRMIEDFEIHHPRLTANLSLIADRLSDMGI